MLSDILDAADKRGETVLVNAYGDPFSAKSLTGMMSHWCKLAGLPPGLTLHGLRKSLGVYLAEAEASTRQLMDVLGMTISTMPNSIRESLAGSLGGSGDGSSRPAGNPQAARWRTSWRTIP